MFLLTATFALVLGLYFARNNLVVSILVSVIYLLFILWKFGRKRFFIVLIFFGVGVLIPRIPLPSNNGPTYSGVVIEAKENYYLFQSKFQKYYVFSKDNDFEVGDRLTLKGNVSKVKFATFESRFNFETYLFNKGVVSEIDVEECQISHRSIIKYRQLKEKILSRFDQNTATLVSALLFNDKDYSSDVLNRADSNNVLFLFTLSGTYLHAMFAISNYFFLLRFSKKKSRFLTFVLFSPLAFFSFTKIGTLRVYGLYFLKYLNEFVFKKHKFGHIELVSILALFFLSIDYHLVYQEAFYIGFLLSVLAPFILGSVSFLKGHKQKIITFFLFLLALMPLRINSSYFTPFYIFKMFFILPLNLVFLGTTLLAIILPVQVIPKGLAIAITWILEKMDVVLIRIPFGDWGGTFSILFLMVFLLLVFYLEAVRIKHAKIAGLVLLAMTTISIVPLQEPISNCVYFVNVGQGDSIIIKNKTHTVMIDTGGYKSFDMAEEVLIPFMNKKKITHIDALILTHDDFDHSGAKDSLINNFKVNNVLTEKDQFPYTIGDLNIENLNTFDFDEANDNSLVLSLDFIGRKFLFMGDASVNTEESIMSKYDVDCDILKVGHHGSNTSSCEKFIKATTPKEAIISVSAQNRYGHPNQEVIDRLNKYNVKIRRTDEEGTICYFSLTA